MDQLARDFAGDAHFIFVYVREAHPERYPEYPPHRTIEQKRQHARDMQQRHSTPRTIIVDTLEGEVHRLYGGLPNMAWILDHTGTVVYKADWTMSQDIRAALEDVVRIREMKRDAARTGTLYKGYYKETISILARTSRARPAPEQVEVEAND